MPQRPSTSLVLFFLIAAFSAVLAGCGSIQPAPPTPAQQAEQLEPMLSAAGFRMLPADTPERQQQLRIAGPAPGQLLRRQDRHPALLHGRSGLL